VAPRSPKYSVTCRKSFLILSVFHNNGVQWNLSSMEPGNNENLSITETFYSTEDPKFKHGTFLKRKKKSVPSGSVIRNLRYTNVMCTDQMWYSAQIYWLKTNAGENINKAHGGITKAHSNISPTAQPQFCKPYARMNEALCSALRETNYFSCRPILQYPWRQCMLIMSRASLVLQCFLDALEKFAKSC